MHMKTAVHDMFIHLKKNLIKLLNILKKRREKKNNVLCEATYQ